MKLQNQNTQSFNPLSAIIYTVSIPIVYALSFLPFKILYIFSDYLYFIVYHFVRYRKKVVLQNLRNSFPEKTDKEINIICKKFYHTLCDFFLETIKVITISKKSILKRCKFNPDTFNLFSKFADEKKSIIMVLGHIGNWEWACNSFNVVCRHQLYVIYHPISNKYFEGLMTRIRTRYGTKLIAMKDTYKEMISNIGGLNATVFVADQSPHPKNAYWTTFLNQETPVYRGLEILSKKMKLPVVYATVKKVKRGYYEMFAETLTEEPESTLDGDLSEIYIRRLEKDIINHPESWLWSHRRWKHKR
jgi:Kdo2-lipid IVA lauroyltransferase/acyltransferase